MQRVTILLLFLIGHSLFSSCQPIEHSEWGEGDQRGAMNRLGPEQVLAASKLIRQGKTIELGRLYSNDMPLPGKRSYQLQIPDSLRFGPYGDNQVVFNVDVVESTLTQIGTQFDGLGHVGRRSFWTDYYYNGFKGSDIVTKDGLTKLGVEQVGAFFTRGILIDIPAYKGVEQLEKGYIISEADVRGCLEQKGLSLREGDVVLVRTGQGQLWNQGVKAMSQAPGLGIAAVRWLAAQKIVMIGADNNAVEATPGEHPKHAIEGHEELLIKHGIYLFENLDLEALSREQVYEFAFSYAPLKLKGATGSPGNPVAIY